MVQNISFPAQVRFISIFVVTKEVIDQPSSTKNLPSSIAPGFMSNWVAKVQDIDLPARSQFVSPIDVELGASRANIAPARFTRPGT